MTSRTWPRTRTRTPGTTDDRWNERTRLDARPAFLYAKKRGYGTGSVQGSVAGQSLEESGRHVYRVAGYPLMEQKVRFLPAAIALRATPFRRSSRCRERLEALERYCHSVGRPSWNLESGQCLESGRRLLASLKHRNCIFVSVCYHHHLVKKLCCRINHTGTLLKGASEAGKPRVLTRGTLQICRQVGQFLELC